MKLVLALGLLHLADGGAIRALTVAVVCTSEVRAKHARIIEGCVGDGRHCIKLACNVRYCVSCLVEEASKWSGSLLVV